MILIIIFKKSKEKFEKEEQKFNICEASVEKQPHRFFLCLMWEIHWICAHFNCNRDIVYGENLSILAPYIVFVKKWFTTTVTKKNITNDIRVRKSNKKTMWKQNCLLSKVKISIAKYSKQNHFKQIQKS